MESVGIMKTPKASIQLFEQELSTSGLIKPIILKAFIAYTRFFHATFCEVPILVTGFSSLSTLPNTFSIQDERVACHLESKSN